MRSSALVLAVAAVAASPARAAAQEETVRLKVGETKAGVGSVRALCDAPSIAVIKDGVLHAVAPGETLCSATLVQAQGLRRVYRVIVTAAEPAGPDDGPTR
jgi:hypothetical protein